METEPIMDPAVAPSDSTAPHSSPAGLWGDRLTRHGTRTIRIATMVLGGIALVALGVASGLGRAGGLGVALLALAGLAILAWFGVLCFFRNPRRTIPSPDRGVVCPADGRVLAVEPVEEPEYIAGPAVRIQIFLSVFDVHVNRAPVGGVVEYLRHRRGTFRNALKADARETNECQAMGLRMDDGTRVLVRQIAGAIARRIVCPVEPGQRLAHGFDYGMIQFGSQTEVSIPPRVNPSGSERGFRPRVRVGDTVRGGETVLGDWGAEAS